MYQMTSEPYLEYTLCNQNSEHYHQRKRGASKRHFQAWNAILKYVTVSNAHTPVHVDNTLLSQHYLFKRPSFLIQALRIFVKGQLTVHSYSRSLLSPHWCLCTFYVNTMFFYCYGFAEQFEISIMPLALLFLIKIALAVLSTFRGSCLFVCLSLFLWFQRNSLNIFKLTTIYLHHFFSERIPDAHPVLT